MQAALVLHGRTWVLVLGLVSIKVLGSLTVSGFWLNLGSSLRCEG